MTANLSREEKIELLALLEEKERRTRTTGSGFIY